MLIRESIRKLIGLFLAISLQFGTVSAVSNTSPAKNDEPTIDSTCIEIIPPKSTAVTFRVPETIYLKPAVGAEADEFEFFIDYETDGSLRTPTSNEGDDINATQNTYGNLYFYCENASGTNATVSVDKASFIPEDLIQNANKYKCTIPNTGKLNVKLSPGQTEVLTWTATYYIDGIAKTAKAYTVCYAPLLEPIASGVKLTWQDNESIAWISGATGLGAGNRTNKPANFIPIIGLIKTSGSVSDYLEGSSGGGHYGEKTGMTGYNWITNDSPKGSVVVDTSRYANLNQLPNLSVGFVVAKNGGSADKSEWHVKNYNGVDEYTGNKKGDSNNATQKSVKGAGSGAPTLATGTGKTTGIKYNNPVWSQNVSETNEMRFRAMSYAYDGSMYRSVGAHTCYMSIIKVDKSALRNLVNSHVDMAEQAASYSHQSARFAAYQKAIKDAAELLGNPASAVTENDIVDKFNTLSKQTYSININHRFNNGRPMQSIQKSFEIGSTVIFGLCDHTGYTPKAAIGYTTSFDTQTVTNCQEDITQYYDYDAHTYTVFYNGNGNTGGITLHTSHTYDLEKKLAKNGFSKNGYTFIEWNTEADGSGVGYEEGQPVKNLTDENGAELTLFAIWKVNKHYIVFNGNSGVGTMDKQEVEFGSSVILYENKYERENYAFVAWNTKQDGTGVSYEDKGLFGPMPDQDVTLYAQWRYAVHNIVFHANGGSGNMENQPLKEGVTEQLNENTFERTGYAFERWNTQEDGLGDSYDDKGEITMGTSNIDLYAQWTAETYTVTFDGNGGTPDKESETVTYDQAYGELPEAEREGYIFAGWYTAKTGGTKVEETTIVTTAQDHTLYALWSINHYTISFESNGGTDVDDISGPYGSVVYEPEEPKKLGHTFDGWYEDEELETPVDWPYTMGASDVIFYAKWTANQYAITFDSNGGTEFEKIIEPYGTEVDEPEDEPEKEGHTFVAWYEDEELETPVSWPYTIGASNVVFYAKWEVKYYNISFDANGGHFTELVGSDIIKMSLPYGSDLVAPTVERAGYDFDGWDPELHNTVPAYDIDFVAKWVRAQTEVSFNLNGATAGTVPDTQKGDIGSAVDLPEQGNIEKLGYEFLGWALTDDADEALETFTFQEEDTVLYAVWKKIPVKLYAKPGSGLVFDKSEGSFIFGILPGTSKDDFILNLAGIEGNGELRFSENEGRFGTGLKVELIDLEDNSVVDSYHIVIFGDVDGDGFVTPNDAFIVRNTAAFVDDIKGWTPYGLAADLNGDGIIDAFDYNLLKAALKGIFVIDQLPNK